jgi:hypothetical protein
MALIKSTTRAIAVVMAMINNTGRYVRSILSDFPQSTLRLEVYGL